MAARPPASVMDASKRMWAATGICAALVVMVFIVFGQTVHFDFVNYDDNNSVYQNPAVIHGFTLKGIAQVFSYSRTDYWHPLDFLTHMLDCQLYGLNPGGHHFTNVLFHATAAALLFLVLVQMTAAFWRSAFVAAVFAVHPLRVESVAWVSERKGLLSGIFFMLTIAAYVRYARGPWSLRRYLAVLGLFALALMSKPTLVAVPILLLALDYWPLGRFGLVAQAQYPETTGPRSLLARLRIHARLIVEKLPLVAMSLASCIEAAMGDAHAFRGQVVIPLTLQLENAVVSCAAYLWQTFWPADLAVMYPFPEHGLPLWQVLAASFVLALISAAAFLYRKCSPWLLSGWLWYLGMLAPTDLVPVGSFARADRYTYLPMIGISIMAAWSVADWTQNWRYRGTLFGSVAAVILAALMFCAYQQTGYWRDSVTLWTHTLACTRDNGFAHNSLGTALIDQGRTAEGILELREALQINPLDGGACNNLANILARQGHTQDAIVLYRIAVQVDPANAGVQNNLSNALLLDGKMAEATAHAEKALELQPDNPGFKSNLAWILATTPETSARNGPRAVQLASEASQASGGNDPVILRTLAAAYAEAGDFPAAVETAEAAVRLAGGNPALASSLRQEIGLYGKGRSFGKGN